MESKVDHSIEEKEVLIQQLFNLKINDKSVAKTLFYFETKFLHDTAINLSLNNVYYIVFVNHFSVTNKDKNIREIAKCLDIIPEIYKKTIKEIYQKFARVNCFELHDDNNETRQIYQKLWNHDFYEWFNSKGYSLLCRRSNQERRTSLLKTDRRQNFRRRLIIDFKLECVKGKLDILQNIYDLYSYSFIEELKKTLIKAINKYEFKDKLTQKLSDPNQIIEQVIVAIQEEVEFQEQSDLESSGCSYLNAIIDSLNPLINNLSLSIISSLQLKEKVNCINYNLEQSLVMFEKYHSSHRVSKDNTARYMTLITLLENIRDRIIDDYDVILDRRKQSNRRNNSQIISLIQTH